jgi:hypothetical protein
MPSDNPERPSVEEMIEALRVEIMILEAKPTTGRQHLAALRAAQAQLEASRWRPRSVAPDTDDPILGYTPIAGDPAEDEQAGHYAITEGSFLRSGGWALCTLWQPIAPPRPPPPARGSEGG